MWVAGAASPIAYVNDQGDADFDTTREDSEIHMSSSKSPLLSSFLDLMQPIGVRDMNSLDRTIIEDNYEEMHEQDLALVILEDRMFETPDPVDLHPSIFNSINLPQIVRYFLPTVIVGAIVMLFTSNISVGASINLSVRFDETTMEAPSIFQFSLAETVSQLYHAGLYPLLVLVLGFSGIWPYVKVSEVDRLNK
jgi:hypothetical protein